MSNPLQTLLQGYSNRVVNSPLRPDEKAQLIQALAELQQVQFEEGTNLELVMQIREEALVVFQKHPREEVMAAVSLLMMTTGVDLALGMTPVKAALNGPGGVAGRAAPNPGNPFATGSEEYEQWERSQQRAADDGVIPTLETHEDPTAVSRRHAAQKHAEIPKDMQMIVAAGREAILRDPRLASLCYLSPGHLGPVMIDGFIPGTPAQLSLLAQLSEFTRRGPAETNPELKQLIPYVVIVFETPSGPLILSYSRSKRGAEERLHDKRSIGIGGHMEDRFVDAHFGLSLTAFQAEAMREVQEETGISKHVLTSQDFLGFINNDEDEVGRVHLGLLYVLKVHGDAWKTLKGDEADGLVALKMNLPKNLVLSLHQEGPQLETWSKMALPAVLAHLGLNQDGTRPGATLGATAQLNPGDPGYDSTQDPRATNGGGPA